MSKDISEEDLNRISKNENNKTLKRLTDTISGICNDIKNSETTVNAQIPESLFVQSYLPEIVDTKEVGNITKEWVRVAGGLTRSVDVVDNKGNVLYTTPPLVASADIDYAGSMTATMNTYDKKNSVLAAKGDMFLEETFKGIKTTTTNERALKVKEEWDNIASKYKTPKTKINSSKVMATLNKDIDDDDLEY
jgi:hypothetical protein